MNAVTRGMYYLLCVVIKLYGTAIIKRIRKETEYAIGEEQCEFRCGSGNIRINVAAAILARGHGFSAVLP